MSSVEDVDREIEVLQARRKKLELDAAVVADVEKREALLQTPFMLDLKKILVQFLHGKFEELRKDVHATVDQQCEEAKNSFNKKMHALLYPSEQTIPESQLEPLIAKIWAEKEPAPEPSSKEKPVKKSKEPSGMVI